MPKNTNMAKRIAVENKNKRVLADALDGKEAIFGKVEKALGNCAFQVKVQDCKSKWSKPKMIQGLIRGSFKGGAKSDTFLAAGMFVIVAAAEDHSDSHEIIAVVNKKKDLKALMDKKLLPECILDAAGGDDIFDYTGFEEVDDLDKDERKARDRILAAQASSEAKIIAVADDADINVDDI